MRPRSKRALNHKGDGSSTSVRNDGPAHARSASDKADFYQQTCCAHYARPRWKVFNNQLVTYDRMGRTATTSARKLAASLWELQDLPLLVSFLACMYIPNWIPHSQRSIRVDSGVLHSQADPVRSPPGYRQQVEVCREANFRLTRFLCHFQASFSKFHPTGRIILIMKPS